jgi:hypothetical protein
MVHKNHTGLLATVVVMIVVAAAVGGLASCATLAPGKETETSQILLTTANEILLERDNGMLPAQFRGACELKFPGLKFDIQVNLLGGLPTALTFAYEGRNYSLGMNSDGERYLSANYCLDITKE